MHPLPRRQALLRLPFPVRETHEARGRLVAPMTRPMLPTGVPRSGFLSSRPPGRGHWQALAWMQRHGPALEARDGMDADAGHHGILTPRAVVPVDAIGVLSSDCATAAQDQQHPSPAPVAADPYLRPLPSTHSTLRCCELPHRHHTSAPGTTGRSKCRDALRAASLGHPTWSASQLGAHRSSRGRRRPTSIFSPTSTSHHPWTRRRRAMLR